MYRTFKFQGPKMKSPGARVTAARPTLPLAQCAHRPAAAGPSQKQRATRAPAAQSGRSVSRGPAGRRAQASPACATRMPRCQSAGRQRAGSTQCRGFRALRARASGPRRRLSEGRARSPWGGTRREGRPEKQGPLGPSGFSGLFCPAHPRRLSSRRPEARSHVLLLPPPPQAETCRSTTGGGRQAWPPPSACDPRGSRGREKVPWSLARLWTTAFRLQV